jgi:hypothetical protein
MLLDFLSHDSHWCLVASSVHMYKKNDHFQNNLCQWIFKENRFLSSRKYVNIVAYAIKIGSELAFQDIIV